MSLEVDITCGLTRSELIELNRQFPGEYIQNKRCQNSRVDNNLYSL